MQKAITTGLCARDYAFTTRGLTSGHPSINRYLTVDFKWLPGLGSNQCWNFCKCLWM